jgi:hypothetical protein
MLLGNNPMHCQRINCRCTHTEGCERGFIYIRYAHITERIVNGEKNSTETWYDGVRFCPVCDPERAHIQKTSTSSEELGYRLRERSKYKHAENYENQEAQKTRTL